MTNFFILSPLSQFEVFQLIGLDLSIIGQFYLALTNLSKNIHKLDSSIITNYALYILSGFIIYILITYFNTSTNLHNELFILLAFGVFSLYLKKN